MQAIIKALTDSETLIVEGKLFAAVEVLEQAVRFLETQPDAMDELAGAWELLGIALGELGQYSNGLTWKLKALDLRLQFEPENSLNIAQLYNNIGHDYIQSGQSKQALLCFEKTLEIVQAMPDPPIDPLTTCLLNIGNCYSKLGDFDNAVAYHFRVLQLRRPSDSPYQPPNLALWRTVNNLGHSYLQKGDYKQAAAFFSEALDIGLQLWPDANLNNALVYNNLGSCYRRQQEYEVAMNYLLQAVAITEQLNGEQQDRQQAPNCLNIGDLLAEQQQYEVALRWYYRALYCAQQSENAAQFQPIAYNGIGAVRTAQEQYQEADTAYENALKLLLPNDDNLQNIENIEIVVTMTAGTMANLLRTLIGMVTVANILYEQSQDLKWAQKTLQICRWAMAFGRQMRSLYYNENAKIILAEKLLLLFEKGIWAALKCYQETGDTQYYGYAWQFTEQSKAQALYESLKDASAKIAAQIDPDLLQEHTWLKAEMASLENKLARKEKAGTPEERDIIAQWRGRLFEVGRQYEQHIRRLEKEYPAYYQLKYDTNPVDLYTLQKQLPNDNTVFISYTIGENEVFVFALKKNDIHTFVWEKALDLDEQIHQFIAAICSIDKSNYCQLAFALYQHLLQPVVHSGFLSENIKNLCIVPHAELYYLPFEALLLSPAGVGVPYQQMDYLLRHYALSYHYSATLYCETAVKPCHTAAMNFGGFAPVDFSTNVNGFGHHFEPLSHSANSIENIKNIFDAKGLNADCYSYTQANLDTFKQKAGLYRYLLLSTHALFDNQDAQLSFIAFADDVLMMADTYNLHLDANLVVLSACETGRGRLANGEGMMGLNRGFLYAGAKQVIFSLFKVPDRATHDLIEQLFVFVLEGKNTREALQAAKLQMAARTGSMPLTWAGFALLG